jgi:hypothetical protein
VPGKTRLVSSGSGVAHSAPDRTRVNARTCSDSGFGTVRIDYANIDRNSLGQAEVFHTRQISVHVFITVHRALVARSLHVQRLNTLPESAGTHVRTHSVVNLDHRGAALDRQLENDLRGADAGEHCLVVVDVLNQYGKPFEVGIVLTGGTGQSSRCRCS